MEETGEREVRVCLNEWSDGRSETPREKELARLPPGELINAGPGEVHVSAYSSKKRSAFNSLWQW